jgi:NAD(P)-dependent dehydrogenase (short-subunit alcohol dehydrogenase family)
MAGRLAGKRALITGAAQGIGQAIAARFAAEGAALVLADIDLARLEPVAAALGARAIACDVAQKAQVEALFAGVADHWGGLDVLVNNAGITHAAQLDDLTEDDFDRVFATNLKSALWATQAAARLMQPGASIINLSSVNAVLAIPNQIPYVISKGAMKQLTNVTALALAPQGIRVNAIGPGSIMTDMLKGIMTDPAAQERILSRTPLGRCGEPDEVASVALFLASPDASYLTGQTIYPDGGRLGLNYTVPVAR